MEQLNLAKRSITKIYKTSWGFLRLSQYIPLCVLMASPKPHWRKKANESMKWTY